MKRLFAAIKIQPGENFLKVYFELQKRMYPSRINWVKPENMHITLKFFGETPEEQIPLIEKVISESLVNFTPFNISLKNTGIFGSSYNPKVIWFGIDDSGNLKKLAESLSENLHENGFLRDRQNFVPHLTVGRIKLVYDKKHFQLVVDKNKHSFIQDAIINKVILFESLLLKTGAQYKELCEFGFMRNMSDK